MEAICKWVLRLIACTMAVGLAYQLCPEGSVRVVLRFTGALALLLVMLSPLRDVSLPSAREPSGYVEAVKALEGELSARRELSLADGIAERLEAYIEDKAGQSGRTVDAAVETENRGGMPVPVRVRLRGEEDEALSEWIEASLGIAKEDQLWNGGQ